MPTERWRALARETRASGLVSVCSAHPLVIEAALGEAAAAGLPALIESTCNQVNQDGGYSGMVPAAFRAFVDGIAGRLGFDRRRIILGGDHLGPNPWRHLPAEEAMARASDLVASYAQAGFGKLHLDASMACAGETGPLGDGLIAERTSSLAARAEATDRAPFYVIGSEVPTPGGAVDPDHVLRPTTQGAVAATWDAHRQRFAGLGTAWERVIALVVQPGVEFGHDRVHVYDPVRAAALTRTLGDMPGVVFEAHSTDYQPAAALARLVADGFAILKVGPALTFAMREALYGLDLIRAELRPGRGSLRAVMEEVMLAAPEHWLRHGGCSENEQRVTRHYGYGDRIRYYWPAPKARQAVADLMGDLERVEIPLPLVSQFLPLLRDRIAAGVIAPLAHDLVIRSIRDVLVPYTRAVMPEPELSR